MESRVLGGETVAEQRLREVNIQMGHGVTPDPAEMFHLGNALSRILGAVEKNAEQVEVLIGTQYNTQKTIDDMRARQVVLEGQLQELQARIPKEVKDKAKAKLANAVAKKSMDVRSFVGAKTAIARAELDRQEKVEITWPLAPYTLKSEGIPFTIYQGRNVLPKGIAQLVEMRLNKMLEGKDVDGVLRAGSRPGYKRDVLKTDEVKYFMNQISIKYNHRPDLDVREQDAVYTHGLQAAEVKLNESQNYS